MGSGVAQLLVPEIGLSTFFRGNSKATAILTGIIANEIGENWENKGNNSIDNILREKSYTKKEIYSRINFDCTNDETEKKVRVAMNELMKREQINTTIQRDGFLDFSRSDIQDFYSIVRELEKIFKCKILGKTKIYKSYFESLNNLAKLVEVSVK